MSTALMTRRIATASPRFKAAGFSAPAFRTSAFKMKIAGALCLLGILAAAFTEISIHETLSVAGGLVAVLAMIAVTLLFSDNFSPVNRRLALLASSFNLVGLVFEALRLQPQGANIAIVFDGFYCLLIGYFVVKSTFALRILSALMALGGLGWLTFLSPPLANYLSPYNLALGLLGEGAVCLWLLLMGADAQRWIEKASGAREGRSRDDVHI